MFILGKFYKSHKKLKVLHYSPEGLHLSVSPPVHHQQPLLVLLYSGQVAELPHHHHHDHSHIHQHKTLKEISLLKVHFLDFNLKVKDFDMTSFLNKIKPT